MASGCEQQQGTQTFPQSLKDARQVIIRSATEEDLESIGRIAYEAFFKINASKGLPNLSLEQRDLFKNLFGIYLRVGCPVLVACDGSSGVCLGSVACDTRAEQCCGIGPITVDPAHQGRGIGRTLMVAAMDHVKSKHSKTLTFRLTHVAANTTSFCLYASLGFNTCGNLLEFHGLPSPPNEHIPDVSRTSSMVLRRATVEDVAGCDELFQQAHGGGMERRNEIHDMILHDQGVHGRPAYVLTDNKDGSIAAYTTGLRTVGHTVGRNEAVFKMLLQMLSVELVESKRKKCFIHIDPVRYPDLVRWMIVNKMQVEKQHTMMYKGCYTGPVAPFVYCPSMHF